MRSLFTSNAIIPNMNLIGLLPVATWFELETYQFSQSNRWV